MKLRTRVLLLVTLLIGATMCFAADPNLEPGSSTKASRRSRPGSRRTLPLLMTPLAMASKPRWKALTVKENPRTTSGPASTMAKTIRHRRLEFRYAVAQEDQRPYAGADARRTARFDYRRIVVAADGKSRTLTANWTDAMGKKRRALPFTTSSRRFAHCGLRAASQHGAAWPRLGGSEPDLRTLCFPRRRHLPDSLPSSLPRSFASEMLRFPACHWRSETKKVTHARGSPQREECAGATANRALPPNWSSLPA